MLLKSIKLDNVRSYTNQKIEFPMGSLLLSGDIGSGKSTILLGIEFALFGSKPSELPASSLLRHGKKEGSVELNFDVDGKDIIIKRILKRGKNGIKQETGYIITNGVKNELSPVEMKSHIFELLGYPKDLVSKGKDLIYRYTVYTPQEEMKRILMEEKDARLNTLRKVFNIDKYRRIKDNAAGFLRSLREKKREIEGFISDLDEKRKELGSITKEVLGLDDKIKVILPKYEKLKGSVKVNRENVNVFEKNINELNKLKNSLNVLETELRNFVNENSRNNESLEILEKQIKAVEEELGKEGFVEDKDIKEKIGKIEDEIKKINQEIDDAKQKINECVINKNKSQEIIKKISEIDECPMCLQNVKHEHKNSISERESKNIAEVEKNLETYSVKGKEFKEKLELLEKEKEKIRKYEHKMELVKLKMKNLDDKKDEKISLGKRQEEIKGKIGKINMEKIDFNDKIEALKNIEEDYKIAREYLDKILEEERGLDIEKAKLEKEKEALSRLITNLDKEIKKKTESKEKLSGLSEMQNWMDSFFVKLMGTMEKHVMLKVQREFNELFKEWFNVLIEDDSISVRLDDDFTPVVEQNGYEANIESLSGGEKTSVALSYRLSLNKVINDVVSGIKTKELLMLDEPTDGFSSEQLDKVRDVLEQLRIKQVIIVSHESKIESFVDKVIRVGKQEHVSSVI